MPEKMGFSRVLRRGGPTRGIFGAFRGLIGKSAFSTAEKWRKSVGSSQFLENPLPSFDLARISGAFGQVRLSLRGTQTGK